MAAGVLYAAMAFAAGFVLGAIRVGVVTPRTGPLVAVVLELPIILAISWLLCGATLRWVAVPSSAASRCLMGATAFVVLIALEAVLSALFSSGQPPAAEANAHAAWLIGLLGQGVFALIPLLQLQAARRAGD